MFRTYKRSRKATAQHFAYLARVGWTYDDICALLRNSTTLVVISELESSVEMSEYEAKRQEKRAERATARAEALASKYGACFRFSGDPRGCPVLVAGGTGADNPQPPKGLPNTSWGGGYAID